MDRPDPQQLAELFHSLEDGTINEEDHSNLMDLMREDASVRKEYRHHMKIVSLLRTEAEVTYSDEQNPASKQKRRSVSYSMMAAAAMLAILAAVGYILKTPDPPEKVIRLTAAHDSSWSIASPDGSADGTILPGTELAIQKGTVELDFSSAVKATIEGPAKIKVLSHNSIRMTSGRAWFEVKPAGHGFTVNTNHLKIVDLGTEFGVISSDSQREEVHVARGRVQVTPLRKKSPPVELTTGEAVSTWITQQIKKAPYTPSAFLHDLPQGTPYIHWSFDSLKKGSFASSGPIQKGDSPPIFIHSFDPQEKPQAMQTPGVHGQALKLPGGRVYATSSFTGIGGGLPRSIAMWVKGKPFAADRVNSNTTWVLPGLAGWGNIDSNNGHWRVAIHEKGDAMVSFWGDWATSMLPKGSSILDGKWHHLTFVFTGKYSQSGRPEIIHYLDGTRVSKPHYSSSYTKIKTDTRQSTSPQLRLGADMRAGDLVKKTFPGEIDELYIFRGIINEEQIRQLMTTNKYEAQPSLKIDETPPLKKGQPSL